ncbi:MAG: hypothetical protein KKA73_17120 [Chloroflexi bacterium]|nr:hypothetical protein [Chloroflexota bacterium]MBU1749409.1 hypothetical protein [Chloroflexota bacterium]MBU1878181.1 hypothetical protein [Chloroflexota bacterium]
MDRERVRIIVLSGPVGNGKTTLCGQLTVRGREQGLDCAGLVCPARLVGERKVGVDVQDVRSGERRPLAETDTRPGAVRTGRYRFDPTALAWGADVLASATPCDVLIVDELGPLELERGQGWANALDVLRAGRFRLAVVVVRPALLATLARAVPDLPTRVVTLPSDPPAALFSRLNELGTGRPPILAG